MIKVPSFKRTYLVGADKKIRKFSTPRPTLSSPATNQNTNTSNVYIAIDSQATS